ncbi:integrase [Mesorhizobium sp. M8A.F.Ca.ET.021.01.1.1]|nr:integrase [Mesorhizobium sp. M8A.F.Ca.ET.021.01.1.1]
MEIETKYLIREKDRHGNVRVYYRRKPGPRIRIRAEEGSHDFLRAYLLASQGKTLDGRAAGRPANDRLARPKAGSLRELIVRYYKSPEYRGLDARTQHVRKLILDKLCEAGAKDGKPAYGNRSAAGLEPRHVRMIRDEHADRPEAANGIVKALRQVYAYALDGDEPGIKSNPAREIKYLKSKGDGHLSWTIEQVEQFEKRHPIGTMARLALALLLYTGQRRSDVVQFGPQHEKAGWLTFTQFKNRNRNPITLAIPIVPALRTVMEKSRIGKDAFLINELGRPFTAAGFGNWFRDRCVEAGVPGRAHGLRKAAASRLAELGCSDREIMAITGHTTSKEVDRYTKGARQRVLAEAAMEKLAGSAKRPQLRAVK